MLPHGVVHNTQTVTGSAVTSKNWSSRSWKCYTRSNACCYWFSYTS